VRLLPLVWAMLWRRRMRTALTFASIAVAFMLFGLLQALGSLLDTPGRVAGADSLLVTHRYGFPKPMPYAYRREIEAVEGVRIVTPVVLFPVVYQDARSTSQPSLAVDPQTVFAADARFVVPPEQLRAWQETRTGLIAGRELAQRYGWKIGDRVPLISQWVKRRDGATHWEFDLVGFQHFNPEIMGEGVSAMRVFVRYDYVDESRADPGTADIFIIKVHDPARAPAVARAVDARFRNSANPTRTQTEAEQQRTMLAQVGDIGLIIRSILLAVFFTLVVVAGNTMSRAFRERIPELAVLKTLGFSDARVAALVAAESLLLCVGAGLAGLGLALLVLEPLAPALAAVLPLLRLEWPVVAQGVGLAAALGIVAAAVPAWRSARLSVIEGLAGR
jgi:putative ABC transport system permease protein